MAPTFLERLRLDARRRVISHREPIDVPPVFLALWAPFPVRYHILDALWHRARVETFLDLSPQLIRDGNEEVGAK
jgi:hypothetical protein